MGVSLVVKPRWSGTLREQLRPVLRRVLRPSGWHLPLVVLVPTLVWRVQLPPETLLKFAAGCLAFFWLPGLAVARACQLRCRPTELAALTLGLGLGASHVAFVAAAAAGRPSAYLGLPLAAAAFLGHRAWRAAVSAPAATPIVPAVSGAVVVIAGAVAFALTLSPVHGVDFARDTAGTHLVGWPDGTLHASIANELSHTFPPRNPLLGDRMLAYHYASELAAVVFLKFLGLPATTVCLRLLPALFIAFTVLSFAALVEQLTFSMRAALLTPLLVLLGEDFSFFVDWWRGTTGVAAGEYFRMPSVFGLYFSNPNLPAVAAFGCAALGISRALRGKSRRLAWLGVSAALLGWAGACKVFFGIQSVVALAACVALGGAHRWRFAQLLALTVVALALFQAPWLLTHREGTVIAVVPTFFTNWIPSMLASLGLASKPWLLDAVRLFENQQLTGWGLAQWAGIAVPVFVVGTLGARLLGVPHMVRALRAPSEVAPALVFLAWFVIFGYVLGLGLRITPLDYPDDYNNSVWFVVESKLVSCVFVGVSFGAWFRSWSPRRAAWVAALQVLALAAPGTLSTFAKLGAGSSVLATTDELRTAQYFETRVQPGSIVLAESSNLRRLLLGEARMRVPFAPEFYLTSFLRRESLEERQRDIDDFWRAWSGGRVRRDLLQKYRVDHVVALRPALGVAPSLQAGESYTYAARDLAARPP